MSKSGSSQVSVRPMMPMDAAINSSSSHLLQMLHAFANKTLQGLKPCLTTFLFIINEGELELGLGTISFLEWEGHLVRNQTSIVGEQNSLGGLLLY